MRREKERYQSRGYGLAFAIFQVVTFYFVWPSLMSAFWESQLEMMERNKMSQALYYMLCGLANSAFLLVTVQGFYGICYYLELPIIERYKCLEEEWPWYDDPETWAKLKWRSVKIYMLNYCIITPIVGYLPYYIFDLPIDLDFSMDGIPDRNKMFAQIFLCMLLEDFTFHCSHRTLHTRFLYATVHKVHHEHKITVSMAGQVAHPIEYIFGNLLPSVVGPALLGKRMHFTTAFTWYAIRYIESCEGHCGYEFSWSPFRLLPFGSDYAYHAYHHSANIGNYSSFFTTWDSVFGSNKAYYEYL